MAHQRSFKRSIDTSIERTKGSIKPENILIQLAIGMITWLSIKIFNFFTNAIVKLNKPRIFAPLKERLRLLYIVKLRVFLCQLFNS